LDGSENLNPIVAELEIEFPIFIPFLYIIDHRIIAIQFYEPYSAKIT